MPRILVFAIVFTLVSCRVDNEKNENETLQTTIPDHEVFEFGFPASQFESHEGYIKRGQFFSNLLTELGVPQSQIYSLTQASAGVFDLRKIRVGNPYKAFFTTDDNPRLAYLVYEDTKTNFVTFGLYDTLFVNISEREIRRVLKYAQATITTSLWNDLVREGINPILSNRLSEIYAWSIDFFGLRRGDSFSAVYEELYVGDRFLDIGTVFTSTFTHAGREYQAYRFIQDDIPQYWNEKGENLRKAFLKAPLSFTRISSGFSHARRHPVTRVVRPHTGVDYAAPRGTPVMSIGDGVVTQRNYAGAGGNTVRIKHNSVYTTAYLHLDRFARGLTVGKRVRQGEVIGYVGSTGLSTGPHLDFRVWKNGTPINPLTMEAPPADPIKKQNSQLFSSTVESMRFKRDSLISANFLDSLVLRLGKR